jgi:SAM-dependent methyltransferase
MRKTDQDWEQFGKTDPYYAVLTEEAYHRHSLDDTAQAKFFDSGRQHIRFVLDTVRRHLVPSFQPRHAIDFGCGVGRLLIPLADICQTVVGLDVSLSMLREARANLDARGIGNVSLIKSEDCLPLAKNRFDFAHSYIVLQHIPAARGEQIFAQLVDAVAEGGVGMLHLTYLRKSSTLYRWSYRLRSMSAMANGVANVRRGLPFRLPMMQMNEYNLANVFQLLHDRNCQHIHVHFTKDSYPRMDIYGAMLFFQKG